VDGDTVLFAGSREPTEIELWTYGPGGARHIDLEPGVHSGRRAGGTTVITSQVLTRFIDWVEVFRESHAGVCATIKSLPERPNLATERGIPRAEIFAAGPRGIRTAVLLPSWHEPGSAKLPILLAPYGGPHHQEVLAATGAYLVPQWLADQGFAVVIADGRGTPGRGPQWERAIRGDFAGPVLDDQVEALHAAAERYGDLDLRRVGIRGWSFGGYVAAMAVLRRPDVFHAAVAGAPVTDPRLYDTHYTERYLGHPDEDKEAYERCSLLPDAPRLARPLLLIHGLADDNVVVAHTLRLSSALLAAGRPHNVLPLSGSTHMAAQEEVTENLLLLQADFLRRSLKLSAIEPDPHP
jgi:dipeptidyl-peptidase-4